MDDKRILPYDQMRVKAFERFSLSQTDIKFAGKQWRLVIKIGPIDD